MHPLAPTSYDRGKFAALTRIWGWQMLMRPRGRLEEAARGDIHSFFNPGTPTVVNNQLSGAGETQLDLIDLLLSLAVT